MLLQLPTEISRMIFEAAMHNFGFSERQSVVNLAMSCRSVYDIIAPILYHTLIVTESNAGWFGSLASSTEMNLFTERVIFHVRSYHNFSKVQPIETRLLVNVENLDSYTPTFLEPLTKLKSIRIPQSDYATAVSRPGRAPSGVLHAVTHITGFLPMFVNRLGSNEFFTDPAGWIRLILESLPALTHLGLTHDFPWKVGVSEIYQFDCRAVETALRTALRDYPRLQCIAIGACGMLAQTRRMDLETVLRNVGDPRVKVWFDMRSTDEWNDLLTLRVIDVKEGRSLWTEARSL